MVLRDVVADDEHAADAVGLRVIVDRAEAVGPPNVLAPAMAGHRYELVLVPGGTLPGHHQLDLRADDVPDLGPALAATLAQRTRMALGTHRPAVGVVIELDQLGPPPDEHRVVAVEQEAHCRTQSLGPASGGAKRRRAQSCSRMRPPISPPPARKTGALDRPSSFIRAQTVRDQLACPLPSSVRRGLVLARWRKVFLMWIISSSVRSSSCSRRLRAPSLRG